MGLLFATCGLRELQDNTKCNNIHVKGITEVEKKEQGIENLFQKIMKENFPNLDRGKTIQIQEKERALIKRNPKRPIPRHIITTTINFK